MNEVIINKKWMEASSATFTEAKDNKGKRTLILETMIVPFGETSRNGVLYNKESIIKTHKKLEGKTLNHNHVTTGANVLPRGKWIETSIGEDGMYGRAEVFDTAYNKDYIEWLQADSSPRVSLQIGGSAKQFKEKVTGKWKKEAFINDWYESSTVNLPGFNNAKGSFAVAMAEAFDGEENMEEGKHDIIGRKIKSFDGKVLELDNGVALYSFKDIRDIIKESVSEENYKNTSKIGQKILDVLKQGKSAKEVKWWLQHLNKSGVLNTSDYNDAISALDSHKKKDVKGFEESFFDDLSTIREEHKK